MIPKQVTRYNYSSTVNWWRKFLLKMSHTQKHRVIAVAVNMNLKLQNKKLWRTSRNIKWYFQDYWQTLGKYTIQQETPWLGYDKDNIFHILDYFKPVQFVNVGFLDENLKTP